MAEDSESKVAQKVLQLARLIYGKYGCIVIISLLLPRIDDEDLNEKSKTVNQILKKSINPAYMHTLFTYRVFLKKGKVDPKLFCPIDKIHPSIIGNQLLFKYFDARVNELRKAMAVPRSQYPPPPKQIIRRSNKKW